MWWWILTLNLGRFFNCLEIGDWPEHGCGAVSRNISVKKEIRLRMWTPSSHRLGSEMNKKKIERKPVEHMIHPHVQQLGASVAIIHSSTQWTVPSNLSLVCLLLAIWSTTVSNVANTEYTIFLIKYLYSTRGIIFKVTHLSTVCAWRNEVLGPHGVQFWSAPTKRITNDPVKVVITLTKCCLYKNWVCPSPHFLRIISAVCILPRKRIHE